MNKLWKILVILGTLMLVSAIGLCLYNYHEGEEAYIKSQYALKGIKELIPEIPKEPEMTLEEKAIQQEKEFEIMAGDDLFKDYDMAHGIESDPEIYLNYNPDENSEKSQYEMPIIQYDTRWYCGYITLPSLNLELPVLDGWSYDNLNIAPCCYEGNPETKDFIIIAHNYNNHFGQIGYLDSGDEIIFTDCNGKKYRYTVSYTEYIDSYNVGQMSENNNSAWDLTLFTCTLNGQSRVTVRAKLNDDSI